jgi:hypothetical protein
VADEAIPEARLGDGRRLVGTSDGLVAVIVGGSVTRWQAALDAAEPVLWSIRLPGLA